MHVKDHVTHCVFLENVQNGLVENRLVNITTDNNLISSLYPRGQSSCEIFTERETDRTIIVGLL